MNISWYCSTLWCYHKPLVGHTTCLMQSIVLLWILFYILLYADMLLFVRAVINGFRRLKSEWTRCCWQAVTPNFNNSTKSWNNGEARKVENWREGFQVVHPRCVIRNARPEDKEGPKHVVYYCCVSTSNKVLLWIDYLTIFSTDIVEERVYFHVTLGCQLLML
jgi:hypothetical protein